MNVLRDYLADGGDMQVIAIIGSCLIAIAMDLYQRWKDRRDKRGE